MFTFNFLNNILYLERTDQKRPIKNNQNTDYENYFLHCGSRETKFLIIFLRAENEREN